MGAFEWLEEMVKHFHVYIYSARFTLHQGVLEGFEGNKTRLDVENAKLAVTFWFRENGMPLEVLEKLEFWTGAGKPTALVYIDDRGYRFTGDNFPTKGEIHRLLPWCKGAFIPDEED